MMNEMVRLVAGVHDRCQREINSQALSTAGYSEIDDMLVQRMRSLGLDHILGAQPFQYPSMLGGHLASKGHQLP